MSLNNPGHMIIFGLISMLFRTSGFLRMCGSVPLTLSGVCSCFVTTYTLVFHLTLSTFALTCCHVKTSILWRSHECPPYRYIIVCQLSSVGKLQAPGQRAKQQHWSHAGKMVVPRPRATFNTASQMKCDQ